MNIVAIGALVFGALYLLGKRSLSHDGNEPLVLVQLADGTYGYVPESQRAAIVQQQPQAPRPPAPGTPGYGSQIGKTALSAGASVGTAAIAGASVLGAAVTAGIT